MTQIVLPLFMTLVGLEAWRAWRRSPGCSRRSNLQIAGALFPLVAVIMAMLYSGTVAGRSPSAWTASLVTIASMGAAAGCGAVLIRATDGRVAELPRFVRPAGLHRAKLRPWLRRIGAGLVLLTASSLIVPAHWRPLPLTVAVLAAVVSACALVPLYFQARRFDYGMTALMLRPWVHWRYGDGKPEAWLGPDGLLYGDDYTPWQLSGSFLIGAAVEEEPCATLVFAFETYSRGQILKSIPMPEGSRGDCALLERELRAACPRAAVDLGGAPALAPDPDLLYR